MKLCFLGKHKQRLVYNRMGKVGDFEWYDCEHCDKKLFTIDNNIWGNDKWKDSWHKTPEEDKRQYNSDGKIREDYLKNWLEKFDKSENK